MEHIEKLLIELGFYESLKRSFPTVRWEDEEKFVKNTYIRRWLREKSRLI